MVSMIVRRSTEAQTVLLVIALAILFSQEVNATIIWDQSPATTGGHGHPNNHACWPNYSYDSCSFVERVEIYSPVLFKSIDVYGDKIFPDAGFYGIGSPATIRIHSNTTTFSHPVTFPGPLIAKFASTISIIDDEGIGDLLVRRIHANLPTPFLLNPGVYWIGMNAENRFGMDIPLLMMTGNAPADGQTGVGLDSGNNYLDGRGGDLAFRISGEVLAVPEPPSIFLFLTMLIGLFPMLLYRQWN